MALESSQVEVEIKFPPQKITAAEPQEKHCNNNNINIQQQQVQCFQWKNYIGIFLTLISSIFFSLLQVTIKLILHIHPITQSIWRYGIYSILNIGVIIIIKVYNRRAVSLGRSFDTFDIFKHIWPSSTVSVQQCWIMLGKLLLTGIIGCAGTLLGSTSLNYITMADATAVSYIALVYVLILGHFCLHEKCSIVSSLMATLIIVGIGIISRPPFLTGTSEFNITLIIGLCIKLIDSLCVAIYTICIRYFRHIHSICLCLIVGIVGFILSIICSFSLQLFTMPSNWSEIGFLIGLGLLHFLTNITFILALGFEKVASVTLLRTAEVPLTFLWQIIILNVLPDTWTIWGSVIVSFGVLITSTRKIVEELPNTSAMKQKLGFCLK